MERKSVLASVKADERGVGTARIATLNAIDRDGDVLLPGLLGGEQTVPVLVAHAWDRLPVGKARVVEEAGALIAKLRINMEMPAGRALHSALKFDLDNPPPRGEWSFGFRIPEGGAERGTFAGRPVRFLKRLEILEVSPVIAGAGIETATLAVKQDQDLAARSRAVVQAVFAGMERRAKALGAASAKLGDQPHRGLPFEVIEALMRARAAAL